MAPGRLVESDVVDDDDLTSGNAVDRDFLPSDPRHTAPPRPLRPDLPPPARNGASHPSSEPPRSSRHLSSPPPTPPPVGNPAVVPVTAPPTLFTIPSDSDSSSIMSTNSAGRSSDRSSRPSVSDDAALVSEHHPASEATDSTDATVANGGTRNRRSSTVTKPPALEPRVGRLSAAGMQQLTDPGSLPIGPAPDRTPAPGHDGGPHASERFPGSAGVLDTGVDCEPRAGARLGPAAAQRPGPGARTVSTPPTTRKGHDSFTSSPRRNSFQPSPRPPPLNLPLDPPALPAPSSAAAASATKGAAAHQESIPSPMPTSIPLPPMSIPTHLQLELAGHRPSPLYIHRSHSSDVPYESCAVKFERLKNMLLLPVYLESTLFFGSLACLDAWLYTFTILPVRFVMAIGILVRWLASAAAGEVRSLVGFVWYGLGRLWRRCRGKCSGGPRTEGPSEEAAAAAAAAAKESVQIHVLPPRSPGVASAKEAAATRSAATGSRPRKASRAAAEGTSPTPFRHRRAPSQPSTLSPFNKADMLQGAIILCTSLALMRLDASKMYHLIRAQSAIKLYVIYNVLEIGDRLLSAVGQDIIECLFSSETLSRNSSGRSKVLLPFGMFLLSLAYCTVHSIALYYQVITLNVAVNSYSNALLTLLLSNQFVEIKGTVFKRIEKDNLFQLTCADVVERFQLWIMLLIIALRNIVEVGGLSVPGAGLGGGSGDAPASGPSPLHSASILPHSFTILPSWLWAGEVLSPFLVVIVSEVVVDTIKHAYVMKFNNIKPAFYGRILDIISKDYYSNAFATPSLTRRLGLPVLPLSCLFIRSSIQTYHMFLATNLPTPLPPSTQTSLATSTATPSSPPFLAALDRLDCLLRDALGRAVYSHPYAASGTVRPWWHWTSDDVVAALTMLVVFFMIFLVLLIAKLLLGMLLLRFARDRYASMKVAEQLRAEELRTEKLRAEGEGSGAVAGAASETGHPYDARGRRVGGFAHIEVPDDARRWIEVDGKEGLKRPQRPPQKADYGEYSGNGVERFEMVAKRIW